MDQIDKDTNANLEIDKDTNAKLDKMFDYVNKNFITLHDSDMKEYGEHFRIVIENLVSLMKQEDDLFKACYQHIYYAGSYWDGLKVGKPTEFDLDVVIKLPFNYGSLNIQNENVPPAFVKIECKREIEILRQHPKWTSNYRHMNSWFDENGFLLQTHFKEWIESVVVKALNTLNRGELRVKVPRSSEERIYLISMKKTGPAMTLNITTLERINLDVDIVPVIEFKHPQWPSRPVRLPLKDAQNGSWFIVPKPRKVDTNDTYWRLAFHNQERCIINNKGPLKPVCRLLKKLRDNQKMDKIASYYIKTVFLWEASQPNHVFKKGRQTYVFFKMLRKLIDCFEKGRIEYFWDRRYNLLEGIHESTISNVLGRLNNIWKNIESKLKTNPEMLFEYLLCKHELELMNEMCILSSNPEKLKVEARHTDVVVKFEAQAIATDVVVKQKKSNSDTSETSTQLDKITTIVQELMQKSQNIFDKVTHLENTINMLRDEMSNVRDELKLLKKRMN